jgi:hypothetical protein
LDLFATHPDDWSLGGGSMQQRLADAAPLIVFLKELARGPHSNAKT